MSNAFTFYSVRAECEERSAFLMSNRNDSRELGGGANSNAVPNMNGGLASEGISGSRIGTGKLITQGGNNGESTASNSVPFGNMLTFLKVTLSLR